jgi:competence protein ComEA
MKFLRLLLILAVAAGLCFSAPPQGGAASKAKAAAKTATTKASSTQLDINTASEKELKELPGIGDVYAGKIIQNRPYRAKNELVQKKVLPGHVYDKVKDMIIAKQPPKKK